MIWRIWLQFDEATGTRSQVSVPTPVTADDEKTLLAMLEQRLEAGGDNLSDVYRVDGIIFAKAQLASGATQRFCLTARPPKGRHSTIANLIDLHPPEGKDNNARH